MHNNIKRLFILSALWLPCFVAAQDSLQLTEGTFKLDGKQEKTFDFILNKGDRIMLDLEVLKGGALTQLIFAEVDRSPQYLGYKVAHLQAKTFIAGNNGKYQLKFANAAGRQSVCKITLRQVKALPVPATMDTLLVVNQVAKVSPQLVLNDNRNWTIVTIDLPQNTKYWSYYIGVGENAQKAFLEGMEQFGRVVSKHSKYGAMAKLATEGTIYFQKTQGPDNVKFWIMTDLKDVELFKKRELFDPVDRFDSLYKNGNVINDAAAMRSPLSGKAYLVLLNDNTVVAIDVIVKVVAITCLK